MRKFAGLGKQGESVATQHLSRKGFRVLGRNVRIGGGELDIVAMEPGGTLVFVEVKTLRQAQGKLLSEQLQPEDQMTEEKMKKFRRAASVYAGAHEELVNDKKGWRLDLVALIREPRGFRVRHYENI
jgi:putative endonuclease